MFNLSYNSSELLGCVDGVRQDSLLVSSAVSQKDALHSCSTASNLGTHVRAHGVDDLMEEVDPNEVSFESPFAAQSSHPDHYGDQLHPGHTLQFGDQSMPPAEQAWVYPNPIYQVHITGAGDFSLSGVTSLADPFPLPSAAKKRGLRDKEKLLHAPMSGLGDLLYDKDAVYININDHLVQFSNTDDNDASRKKRMTPLYGSAMYEHALVQCWNWNWVAGARLDRDRDLGTCSCGIGIGSGPIAACP